MNATLLGLLAPVLFGQVQVPLGGAGRPYTPPIIHTSPPLGGSSLPGRTFDSGLNLKSTIPDVRTPQLNIPGNASPLAADSAAGSPASNVTAVRDEQHPTSVATPSGMVPPPPDDVHEAPPDGGDDDDDDKKNAPAPGFEWGKAALLIVIGGLFLYGLSRPSA